jgi:hypothetical protein
MKGNPVTQTATELLRCSCGDEFADLEEIGTHHAETAHVGMWIEPEATVDGQPAKIVHGQSPLPISVPPMTLAKALEVLDEARERHAKYKLQLADAKGFEKDAQAWVNTCVDQLCDVARREAEPELPFNDVAE